MAPSSPESQTLTLDSTQLFLSATGRPQSPLPPIPPSVPKSHIIPNTRFLVDAFLHSGHFSASYFLSAFTPSATAGLSPSWSRGLIFCSPATALLLSSLLRLSPSLVVPLPLAQRVVIDGAEVVLLDAAHCPGSVHFLFTIPRPTPTPWRYVYTGHFQFSGSHDPIVNHFVGSDAVFLDTSCSSLDLVFPSRRESVDYIVSVMERVGGECASSGRVLFLLAAPVVGKEDVLLEVARRCKVRIGVDGGNAEALRVLGHWDGGVFTEDGGETNVRVVGWDALGETWPYFRPDFGKMREVMGETKCSRVVGFVPTGRTYDLDRGKFSVRTKGSLEIHLVPCKEHSSYEELGEYLEFLKPKCVIPTDGLDVEKLSGKHTDERLKFLAMLVNKVDNDASKVAVSNPNEGLKGKKTKLSDVKASQIGDVDFSLDSLPREQDLITLNDEQTKKTIEELHECLPRWVTREQILYLINISGSNIVEAVSNFYDRETEFYEQVVPTPASGFISQAQTNSLSKCTSFLKPDIPEISPSGSTDIPLTQRLKSSNMKPLNKKSVSPGKKKGTTANKPNKKAKTNSKLDSSGKGQTTITRFFTKPKDMSNVSLDGGVESKSDQCPEGENLMTSDAAKSYRDEIDQFVRIVNGDESLRSYAATIMAKANGDINMALNIYYSNSTGDLDRNKERSVSRGKSIQPECVASNCSLDQEKHVPLKLEHLANLSVQKLSVENVDATAVLLPPEEYNPIDHACWKSGQRAPYAHLARTFDLVEVEKGKTKATSMICNMFRSLLAMSPEDVLPAVYLCTNKIAADHENMELNIGQSLVTAALEESCGVKRSKIKDMYNNLGDLGDVAQVCRQTQTLLAPPPPLLIKDVFSILRKISVQTGSGSTVRKKSLITDLMRSCREKEMKFLVRTLVRNLRIGAMMRTVLPALAQAVVLNSRPNFRHRETADSLKEKLQGISAAVVEAYNILPDLDIVVPSLLKEGIGFSSSTLSMVPGIPIKPMLAKITNGVEQALKNFHNKAFTCEYKYDGQRAQIHKVADGTIRVFSRNGDETTKRFPDLISIVKESCKPTAYTFILDAEVVAVDRTNGCKLMSFQELSSRERGRKDSLITLDSIKVDICVFVFDIMFANGEQLLGSPLRQRRKYFMDLFHDEKLGYFEYAKEITSEANDAHLTNEATSIKIASFLEDAFRSSCEGIMVKSLDVDAGYTPSKRSDTWLKVKRDYVQGLGDSVDLVPIGAWHGNGRKAGWYSPFLMACYNPETEEFQSVCRVMSGFSDSFYREMKEFFSGDKILSKKPTYYRTGEVADMWFSPEIVWEIRGADFTVSPVHEAAIGLVHPSRGISIRFPRFVSSVSDRNPEDCSTAADIAEMFRSQTRKMDVMVEAEG